MFLQEKRTHDWGNLANFVSKKTVIVIISLPELIRPLNGQKTIKKINLLL